MAQARQISRNPLYDARTLDEAIRLEENNYDILRGVVRDVDDPRDFVLSVMDASPAHRYRVVQTQSVRWHSQYITLRRDQEFRIGRYGTAEVQEWLDKYGLQIVQVAPALQAPKAKAPVVEEVDAGPVDGPKPAAKPADEVPPVDTEKPKARKGGKKAE